MNKTHRLIIIIILFAILSALLSAAYRANKTKLTEGPPSIVASSTDTIGTTSGGKIGIRTSDDLPQPKLYSNQNVQFSSPQQMIINANSDHQFIVSKTIGGKSSFVEMYLAKTGDCYMDFCKAVTQSTLVRNGITWEFLGNPEYCDAKECSQPSALYRTKRVGKDIYLAFFEYGPPLNKDAIFSTFVIK